MSNSNPNRKRKDDAEKRGREALDILVQRATELFGMQIITPPAAAPVAPNPKAAPHVNVRAQK